MNKFFILLFGLFGSTFAAIIGITLYGNTLPKEYRVTHMRTIDAPVKKVFSVLAHPEGYVHWKPGLAKVNVGGEKEIKYHYDTAVEIGQDSKGQPQDQLKEPANLAAADKVNKNEKDAAAPLVGLRWEEFYKSGQRRPMQITYAKKANGNQVLYTILEHPTLPYTRRFQYLMKPKAKGQTMLVIHEEGTDNNPFMRVWNRVYDNPVQEISDTANGLAEYVTSK